MDYSAYISPNCEFCNQLMSMVSAKQLTNVNFVDVHKKQVPQGIHSVPSIVDSNGKLYVGKQCFAIINSMKSSSILGVDSSNGFSFIEEQRNGMSNNYMPFSFIENDSQNETKEPNMIDDLIAKRNGEVPQPIMRR